MRTARIPSRRTSLANDGYSAPAEECDLSVVSDTFGFLVRAAQVRAFQAFHQEFKDVGLTPASHAALAIISRNPGIRQGFVASLLTFREPNMTKLVKSLIAAGLLTKVRRPDDKRATGLELTEKGAAFMIDINERASKLDERFTAKLKKGERETLIRLLKTVLMNGPPTIVEPVEFLDD